jgi:hypothetical protein
VSTNRPVPRVSILVRALLPLFALSLSLAGCTGSDVGVSTDPKASPSTAPAENSSPPKSRTGTLPPPTASDLGVRPGTYEIKEAGSDGWEPASSPAGDLGDKIDSAFRNVKEMLVDCNTNFEIEGAQLSGKTVVKVRDAKAFKIEFLTPETAATINRLYADGKARVMQKGDSWTSLPEFGPLRPVKMSDAAVSAWPTTMLERMWAPYSTDEGVYGSLFRAWEAGRGGYKVVTEESTRKVGGLDRRYVRVLAKSASPASEVEIVLDTRRMLPVTIRAVWQGAAGENRAMWSGDWQSGGEHADSDFVIPRRP